MNKTTPGYEIDWQLTIFFVIAYLIAWPITFIFGVDDEAIRVTYSPIAATIIIYLPKKEYKMLPLNLYFMAMSIFVLIGGWSLVS